jgi:hypothetical protein
MLGDIVTADFVIENLHVHSNSAQRWYYLNEQTASEALVFRDVDSSENYGERYAGTKLWDSDALLTI